MNISPVAFCESILRVHGPEKGRALIEKLGSDFRGLNRAAFIRNNYNLIISVQRPQMPTKDLDWLIELLGPTIAKS